MILSQLASYDKITIMCHDNPDADAIASGFGLYTYFKDLGKEVQLIYSGYFKIKKTNLVKMIELLNIPITYYEEKRVDGLLITVDCQYGGGNVSYIEADDIAIIDHHQPEIYHYPHTYILNYLGSCSTIIWHLLSKHNFSFDKHPNVATALYYGLYTDTTQFNEIYHPLDKDMRDDLKYDIAIFKQLKFSNLSLNDIEVAGLALLQYYYDKTNHCALIKAKPCDPNILGVISDMMLQVDCIDTCVVYNILPMGIKLSVRSCIREVQASELSSYLTQDMGSGSGHTEKAGSFLNVQLFHKKYPDLSPENYLMNRLKDYFSSYEIIDAKTDHLDMSGMQVYQKLQFPIGYIDLVEFLPPNTPIMIRTQSNDIELTVSRDTYIMIGAAGDVYPLQKTKFHNYYTSSNVPFTPLDTIYFPSIKNKLTGETIELKTLINTCLPKGEAKIYARVLTKRIKVFPLNYSDTYVLGRPNDYCCTIQTSKGYLYYSW